MGTTRELLFHQGANRVDLCVRNRRPQAASSDEPQHAVDPKHPQTLLVARHQLDEQITAEQWQFYSFFSVAPAMHLGDSWQEGGHASFTESVSHNSFVSGAGLHRIPVFDVFPDNCSRIWKLQ